MAIVKRKRSDGSTAFGVVVFVDGAHKWVGTCDTRSEARELEKASESSSEQTHGFTAFADEWLTNRGHLAPNTLIRYRHAAALAQEHFGDLPVSAIDTRAMESYMASLNHRFAPQSANVHFDVFRSIMKSAHAYGLAVEPPLISNRPRRRNTRDIHPLTPEEHRLLVAHTGEWYRPLVSIWPLIGLRSSEMFALEWGDIDGDMLYVRRPLKTDASKRTIPLSKEARAILAGMERPSELVFVNTLCNPIIASTFRTALITAAASAKLGTVRPHDMRHTFATWMIYSGANIKTLQRLMGHANVSLTLDRYGHFFPERDAESVAKMDEWLAFSSAGIANDTPEQG